MLAVSRRDRFLLLVSLVWAVAGYLRYRTTLEATTVDQYLRTAWDELKYSDIVFLYFRDGLSSHPIPYVQYQLEYPVLLGSLSFLASLSGSLVWYFTLTYLVLTISMLVSIYLLDRLTNVDAAYLAFTPGLVLYIGLNWDMAAICLTVIGLRLLTVSPVLAAVVLTGAVWFKFFPIVFLGSLVIDLLRKRDYHALTRVALAAAIVTAVINGPLAIAYFDRWSQFFRLNRERGADSSFWMLNRGMDPGQVNAIMTVALVVGGAVLVAICWRLPQEIVMSLGALALVWWMVVNKTFQPQYAIWVYAACTILRPRWSIWAALVGIDLAGYAISFLYQFEIHQQETFGNPRSPAIEAWTFDNLYVPIQVVRAVILVALLAWGIWQIRGPARTDLGEARRAHA